MLESYLITAETNQVYSQLIGIDPASSSKVRFEWLEGAIPEGMDLALENGAHTALLSGTTKIPGTYYFSLRAENAEGVENSRQFMLEVTDVEQK